MVVVGQKLSDAKKCRPSPNQLRKALEICSMNHLTVEVLIPCFYSLASIEKRFPRWDNLFQSPHQTPMSYRCWRCLFPPLEKELLETSLAEDKTSLLYFLHLSNDNCFQNFPSTDLKIRMMVRRSVRRIPTPTIVSLFQTPDSVYPQTRL